MKKLFTLVLLLASSLTAGWAQESKLIFVDKDGNVVPDGSEITIVGEEKIVSDDWGTYTEIIIKTGLYVKNTDSDELGVLVDYQVEELPNGAFQICFPMNCIVRNTTGHWQTGGGVLDAGVVKDLQSEWIPDEKGYGTARATYQIMQCDFNALTNEYTVEVEGPKVTVNFVYPNPTGVETIESAETQVTGRYSVDGQQLSAPQKGINIIRLSDGRTIKSLIK